MNCLQCGGLIISTREITMETSEEWFTRCANCGRESHPIISNAKRPTRQSEGPRTPLGPTKLDLTP
jgi:hypothetical protein